MNEKNIRGAWLFELAITTNDIHVVEPDGTKHTVPGGDMNSHEGKKLLSAMVRELSTPPIRNQQSEQA